MEISLASYYNNYVGKTEYFHTHLYLLMSANIAQKLPKLDHIYIVLYSGKRSREKTLANFAVLRLSVKIFSVIV